MKALTTSPPTCDSLSNVQGTTSTTNSTITSKRTTQEWTRFVLCCSTALLPLRPHQDGAAQVDTPTAPSPAQVHRHQILFVVPRAKIVKKTATLYTTTTLKNNDIVKTKLPLRKHENGNDNANTKRKSERVYTKKHKMPRHNVKSNNCKMLKHLRSNKPSENQVKV